MTRLPDIIKSLHTTGGFLLVAHGQSGDLGNAVEHNYNVAHENVQDFSIDRYIQSYITTKLVCGPLHENPYRSTDINPILYGNLKKKELAVVPVTMPRRKRVSRSGMFGPLLDYVLGYQVRVEQMSEFQEVMQYNKTETLDTHLQTTVKEAAYFMAHYLRLETPLQDHSRRRCPAPILYILGDQAAIENTINYLKQKPAQYTDFMKALIPAQRFPITNQLIVDQVQMQNPVFLNLDKITGRIRDENLESICERLGEK